VTLFPNRVAFTVHPFHLRASQKFSDLFGLLGAIPVVALVVDLVHRASP